MLLCSLLPVNYLCQAYNVAAIAEGVKKANALLAEIAAEYGFDYVDYYSKFCEQNSEKMRRDLSVDGLHPNAKGYRIMADVIKKYIE